VNAIHPSYVFLSESLELACKVAEVGVMFVGLTVETLLTFCDKMSAWNVAIQTGMPVVPGNNAFCT
jgi:pyruvate carboxylase